MPSSKGDTVTVTVTARDSRANLVDYSAESVWNFKNETFLFHRMSLYIQTIVLNHKFTGTHTIHIVSINRTLLINLNFTSSFSMAYRLVNNAFKYLS